MSADDRAVPRDPPAGWRGCRAIRRRCRLPCRRAKPSAPRADSVPAGRSLSIPFSQAQDRIRDRVPFAEKLREDRLAVGREAVEALVALRLLAPFTRKQTLRLKPPQ